MSADHERRLLARARELADLDDLRDDTLACLGAARHAGLDPNALTGLVGCAAALGASGTATYTAGDDWTGTHADERHFLSSSGLLPGSAERPSAGFEPGRRGAPFRSCHGVLSADLPGC
jgi:hypothetical protein